LLTFIPTLLSGLVLYLYLPSGGGRGSSWATWMGIARHDWIFWHDAAGFAFAILILIHLLLHGTFFREYSPHPLFTGNGFGRRMQLTRCCGVNRS
jgi:hypothetical protein